MSVLAPGCLNAKAISGVGVVVINEYIMCVVCIVTVCCVWLGRNGCWEGASHTDYRDELDFCSAFSVQTMKPAYISPLQSLPNSSLPNILFRENLLRLCVSLFC